MACKKYEREPKDWFTADLAYDTLDQNGITAGFALNNLYTYIPTGFNRISGDFFDAGTDDALPSRYNRLVENYTNGRVSALNNPDPYWSNSYYGIRSANVFLKNIEAVPVPALTKQYWRAEARFLRAFFYWELLKRYGGVPLLGDAILDINSSIEIGRSSYAETVDYIVKECSAITDSLRPVNISSSDFGRITKGAAVALKCRTFLYAASPLFNGGAVESDPVKKALTGYPTADASRWQKVIEAYQEYSALGYYTLVTTGTPTGFASVFTNRMNNEIIFAKQSATSITLETTQSPVGYIVANQQSQGLTSPTQNFVDAFPMANGLAINETGSGYNSSSPYTGRDPRLAVTVFYNGLTWLNRPVETFIGGLDKPQDFSVPTQTRTGYYLRKFLGNFSASTTFSAQSHNFPIFRHVEMLLNYAEALNETGQVETAVNQIKTLRARAGITPGANTRYGIKTGITKDEMRTLIYNERRIELAFEEHRFWDVRRWKIAAQVLNQPLKGIKITKGTGLTFEVITVANPVFDNRLYHMPIPLQEIRMNSKLIQNEGW